MIFDPISLHVGTRSAYLLTFAAMALAGYAFIGLATSSGSPNSLLSGFLAGNSLLPDDS